MCGKPVHAKGYCKNHYQSIENPRSKNHGDLQLWISMNRVRQRDGNKCKWYDCGVKPTHVHHIFPQSEYPELKYLEKYMISYCKNHHKQWHEFRGDRCYTFL